MSTRRAPLANNTNAVNSPYRATAAAYKRPRLNPADPREQENQGSPPKKRQIIDTGHGTRRVQEVSVEEREGKVFLDRGEPTPPNAFTRKLTAIRDGPSSRTKAAQRTEKVEKADHGDIERVKQWRKHFRRAFPTFVFYFENVPHDVAVKHAKQISFLGAVCVDEDQIHIAGLT